jgi:hypothetical protein
VDNWDNRLLAGQDPVGDGRHHAAISATPEHHLVLAVVAEPDVVTLPAFMPTVTPPEASDGLNRRTTGLVVVRQDAQSSGSTTPPRR